MKKVLLLVIAVLFAAPVLKSQTLRMTNLSISEQKILRTPRNNHVIVGLGFAPAEEGDSDNHRYTDLFGYLGYSRTDVLLDNKLGFYLNLTKGDYVGNGVVVGATWNYYEEGFHKLYFIGGLGLGSYQRLSGKVIRNYSWGERTYYVYDMKTLPRIEVGALYSYRWLDIRATLGLPDYFTFGVGYNF